MQYNKTVSRNRRCMTIRSNLCNHALEGDVLIVDLILPFTKLPVCTCTEPNSGIRWERPTGKTGRQIDKSVEGGAHLWGRWDWCTRGPRARTWLRMTTGGRETLTLVPNGSFETNRGGASWGCSVAWEAVLSEDGDCQIGRLEKRNLNSRRSALGLAERQDSWGLGPGAEAQLG